MSAVYSANGSVCSNNKQSTAKGGRGGGGVIGVAAAGVWEGGRRFSGLCLATVKLFAV